MKGLPAEYSTACAVKVAQRFSLVGIYSRRVFGLNATGGQSLPPHCDGQKAIFLSVPGLCSGSTSGLPVLGSTLLKTFCFTNGSPSTKLISPSVRSRNQR